MEERCCVVCRWRHVVWGHSIQFVFALIALRWELGNQIVQCLSSKVRTVQ